MGGDLPQVISVSEVLVYLPLLLDGALFPGGLFCGEDLGNLESRNIPPERPCMCVRLWGTWVSPVPCTGTTLVQGFMDSFGLRGFWAANSSKGQLCGYNFLGTTPRHTHNVHTHTHTGTLTHTLGLTHSTSVLRQLTFPAPEGAVGTGLFPL